MTGLSLFRNVVEARKLSRAVKALARQSHRYAEVTRSYREAVTEVESLAGTMRDLVLREAAVRGR